MSRLTITLLLMICIGGGVAVLSTTAGSWHLPGNNQGYAPEQPIAFSHHLHAGELAIQCLYCHHGAEVSRTAGVPSAELCMNCHRHVTAPLSTLRQEAIAAQEEGRDPQRIVSEELQKLYDALALDENGVSQFAGQKPIRWVRVHDLPDFVYFDHRAHVGVGVSCQECHGPVETMDRVEQFSSLSMGWCVNCHRDASATGVNGKAVKASVDCSTCHY